MSWINIGGISVNRNWQFIPAFTEQYYLVRNVITPAAAINPLRNYCLIAQILDYSDIKTEYQITKHYLYDDFSKIYQFNNPFNLPKRLAIKLVGSTQFKINWTIHIDVWQGDINNDLDNVNLEALQTAIQADIANLNTKLNTIPRSVSRKVINRINRDGVKIKEDENNSGTFLQSLGF